MPLAPESQKNLTTRVKNDGPDMLKLRTASYVSGSNYTCSICGQAIVGLNLFRMHAMEAHGARNKEPYLGRI